MPEGKPVIEHELAIDTNNDDYNKNYPTYKALAMYLAIHKALNIFLFISPLKYFISLAQLLPSL